MTKRPSSSDIASKGHWNISYELKGSATLWGGDAVPFASKAVTLLQQSNCRIVADLPCGDGRNTMVLANGLPFVVALDASDNALKMARARLESAGVKNCILQKCDIFDTQFQDSQLDAVFCWDVLGHFQNVHLAMTEIIRICRKKGKIIGSLFATSDPNMGVGMHLIGDNEYMYQEKFYYRFYSRENVNALISQWPAQLLSLDLEEWNESAHEGFREYPHKHHSWVFVLQKD